MLACPSLLATLAIDTPANKSSDACDMPDRILLHQVKNLSRLLTFEIDYIQDSVTIQSKPVFRYTHNNSKPLSITAVPERRKHLTIVWVQCNCSDYAKTIISEKVKRYAPPGTAPYGVSFNILIFRILPCSDSLTVTQSQAVMPS